jgi:acyl-CoA synthetase (AMP-forming)/AMP-acid ligase II
MERMFKLGYKGDAVVCDDGRAVSYVELKQLTDEWAAKVPSRSLVFLLVGNNLDSLVSYVACLNHGIVPLMLDARGRRLSKRDRDQGLDGALAHFASVEAFIGYVAWLSGLREVNEPITMEGLVTEFSLDSLKGKTALRWVLPD